MDLWNSKTLSVPAITTYKAKNENMDIVALKNSLLEAAQNLKIENRLKLNLVYLRRMIYKLSLKFRNDKGFKSMQKVHQAVMRYCDLELITHLNTLKDLVPEEFGTVMYLPTLNVLQFVLVRIQGASKLLVRSLEMIKECGEFLNDRINRGHLWKVVMICFGIISSLYTVLRRHIESICLLYQQLVPFTKIFKNLQFNWLPSDYVFPEDLNKWLNTEFLMNLEMKIPQTVINNNQNVRCDPNFENNLDLTEDIGTSIKRKSEANLDAEIPSKKVKVAREGANNKRKRRRKHNNSV